MSINRLAKHAALPTSLFITVIAVLLLVFIFLLNAVVYAADYPKLSNRSLSLDTTVPGETAQYIISWRWPNNTSIGSVRFTICADPYVNDVCSESPGDLSAATLSSQSGLLGGFNIASQSSDEIVIARGSAGMSGTGQYSFTLDNVENPGGLQRTFFIQIRTYISTDGSGTPTHISSVANATTTPIAITTIVPQILYFCAGLTITEWCNSVNGNFIDYGDLDPDNGHWATSQFGVATNALGGYVVTVNGNTMTSGNKLIEPLSSPAAFTTGVAQFGLNLRANTLPPVGQDAFGSGIGVVDPDYDTPDMFQFIDGDVVASAVTGSMFNTYTVTYIVNIPPDQPSGVYNTTIAYICTAAF